MGTDSPGSDAIERQLAHAERDEEALILMTPNIGDTERKALVQARRG